MPLQGLGSGGSGLYGDVELCYRKKMRGTASKVLRIYYEWCFGPKLRNQTALLNPCIHSSKSGGAGESRTPDTQFRKLLLYPSELQPRRGYLLDFISIWED